ncbi:MAG: gluconokinase [Acidobacteria bacterium]|nr:gluconokinase [Acidobacteriota bacterium]
MTEQFVMAIDIGSSSVRASLYDLQCESVPGTEFRVSRGFDSPVEGASEMAGIEAFDEVVSVIDGCLSNSENVTGTISDVSITCFWHSLVGLDKAGKPTTPVFGWADTRSGRYTEVLRREFDEVSIHNRVGAHFHSSFWPAKLLRLQHDEPDVWLRTTHWVSFSDYVFKQLTGRLETSVSMASGTGLLDVRSGEWDEDLRKFVSISLEQLPRVTSGPARLNDRFAARWRRLANAEIHIPIADGVANSLGSSGPVPGRAALMLGTSGAVRVIFDGDPPDQIPRGLWCYRIDNKLFVLGGALSDGGNLIAKFSKGFAISHNLDQLIATARPSLDGPLVMPFYFGERSTGYHENAQGAVYEGPASGPAEILRTAMEGVAFRFAEILDRLERVVTINEIVASGGAFDVLPVWARIITDVLGRSLNLSCREEVTSRGAALFALGLVDETSGGEPLAVDPVNHTVYRKLRERHDAAYEQHFS